MTIEAVRIGAEDEQPASGALGFVDHAPFAGFGVNLAYGELSDGTIISIAKAARGRACQCVCPACRANLIARKGDELAHHFAHDGLGTGCGFGPETNAHIWAKEVLERELKILLPARYIFDEGGKRQITGAARVFEFVAAKLERRVGRIVPDVILTAPDGREFVVEVKVTHASTQAKKDEMRESNLPGIEVNLRAFRTSTDEEAVRDALLFNAPRSWLHNARIQAWHVTNKGDDSFWTKVGAAWPHRDGKGLSLILSVIPMNGQIVLREPRPRD